jgi:hypothetical protein
MSRHFSSPQEIEALLRSAVNPIQPSADLRSNILEAAVEQENDRSADKRLSRRILLLFSFLFIGATVAQYAYFQWIKEVGDNADRHVYARSERLAAERKLRAESSFLEAFWKTREEVASRFRDPE